ncbi:MAG TPA: gas vesicle protein GvpJ [Marmoricola sp.]|nr:gas vesicle protein GvpJ [Marmoricola sp.]
MTTTATRAGNRYMERPAPSSLADVINTILDKGLVIDIYVRVSLVGIELLTIDARIVIASVDTYLRFAEAVNRLDLTETETHGIPELMQDITESGAKGKTSGALEGAKEKLGGLLSGDDDDEDEGQERPSSRSSSRSQSRSSAPTRKRSQPRRRRQAGDEEE